MIRRLLAAAVLSATVTLPGNPAFAASFEGPWSVTIVTEAGQCDAAYNFPLTVTRGRVVSSGGTAMAGSVSGSGAVNVSITQGASSGRANGRLASTSGSGRWSGVLNGAKCSGRWEASRR